MVRTTVTLSPTGGFCNIAAMACLHGTARLMVLDGGNHPIQVIDGNGQTTASFCSKGSGKEQLKDPAGCALGEGENGQQLVYVCDYNNHRVVVLNMASEAWTLSVLTLPESVGRKLAGHLWEKREAKRRVLASSRHRYRQEQPPHRDRFLIGLSPRSLWVNSFSVDYNNHRVQVFDARGRFLTSFGSHGSEDGCFNWPAAVAVDSNR